MNLPPGSPRPKTKPKSQVGGEKSQSQLGAWERTEGLVGCGRCQGQVGEGWCVIEAKVLSLPQSLEQGRRTPHTGGEQGPSGRLVQGAGLSLQGVLERKLWTIRYWSRPLQN